MLHHSAEQDRTTLNDAGPCRPQRYFFAVSGTGIQLIPNANVSFRATTSDPLKATAARNANRGVTSKLSPRSKLRLTSVLLRVDALQLKHRSIEMRGCAYGVSAIPQSWRNGLMEKDLIEGYADRLLAHSLVSLSHS